MKRTRIRSVSKARAKQLRIYRLKVMEFLLTHPMCRVCLDEKIEGMIVPQPRVAEDVHHRRGRVGRLLLEERFWMPVCRIHHDAIHQNPAWAKAHGYIKDWLRTNDL